MKKSYFELLVNILLGASWAIAFFGSVLCFYIFSGISFMTTIMSLLLGALPGLFFVVFFELAFLQIKKFENIEYQTKLLEDIKNRL